MEIKEQSDIRRVLSGIPIPNMYHACQRFDGTYIEDIPSYLWQKLNRFHPQCPIRPGMKVVLTGSSRQISNANVILRELASYVKAQGGIPYIIPAMGSHGGATAQGQREILEGFGITEDFCGCQIHSSMDTVEVGRLEDGDPVYADRFAVQADAVIVVGRIKAHTAFRGQYESGLIKMIAVGLGKHKGADSLHQKGFGVFAQRLPACARVIMNRCNIIMGVGIIENAFDQTCRIEVLQKEEIFEQEPALLEDAKRRMPQLFLPEADVLIVREIGKNFSGCGMDPNVTGTFGSEYCSGGLKKQRTVVLDISEQSHGNFLGLGEADITTKRAFQKCDTNAAYLNMLTSTILRVGKIPMVLEDDRLAIQAALKTLTGTYANKSRIIYIKNTLSLETIMVSEALADQVRNSSKMELLGAAAPFHFDLEGNLLDLA